jgi:hypothetical protein
MTVNHIVREYEAQGWQVWRSDPVLGRVTLCRNTRSEGGVVGVIMWTGRITMIVCTFGFWLFSRPHQSYITVDASSKVPKPRDRALSHVPRPQTAQAQALARGAAQAAQRRRLEDEVWAERRASGYHKKTGHDNDNTEDAS